MPGPSGEVGAGKLAAAKAALEKRQAFLAGLRVKCPEDVLELISGPSGQVLLGKAIDLAVDQATEVAYGQRDSVAICFTDKKGNVVPLVQVVATRNAALDCSRTIAKWEKKSPAKKSVKVRKNRSVES